MGRVVQREGRDLWLACMSCENVGQKDNVVLEKVWKRSGGILERRWRENRESSEESKRAKRRKEKIGRGCVNTRARKKGTLSPHSDCTISPFESPVNKVITVFKSHSINMRHSCAGCPPPCSNLPQLWPWQTSPDETLPPLPITNSTWVSPCAGYKHNDQLLLNTCTNVKHFTHKMNKSLKQPQNIWLAGFSPQVIVFYIQILAVYFNIISVY